MSTPHGSPRNKRRGLQPARCHDCEAVVYLEAVPGQMTMRRAGQSSCSACGTDEAMPGHEC